MQRALVKNGQIVKIGTTQFYSKEQERMITMYILSTPVDFLGKSWCMETNGLSDHQNSITARFAELSGRYVEGTARMAIDRGD